jgi:predicted nucleic acid-binding protein
MSLVVDASVAVQWHFRQSTTDRANAVLRSGETLIAPDIVIVEIASAAWRAATFEGRPSEAAAAAVRESTRFFSELVPSISLKDRALAIALDLRHPVYDCFYLALVELRDIDLITADSRLLRRCANTRFADHVKAL